MSPVPYSHKLLVLVLFVLMVLILVSVTVTAGGGGFSIEAVRMAVCKTLRAHGIIMFGSPSTIFLHIALVLCVFRRPQNLQRFS